MMETDHEIVEQHLLRIRGALDVFCEDVRGLKRPPYALENRYRPRSCRLHRIDSRIERRLDLFDA
jgi:hypothetical protein